MGDDGIEKLFMGSQNLETFKGRTFPIFPILMKCVCAVMLPFLAFFEGITMLLKMRANLVLYANWKALTVHHSTRGTYIGCRLTKRCGKCRLYGHYGFSTEGGLKMFDESFWNREFLLSTEDTAVDMNVLKHFKQEFVMGYSNFMESKLIFIQLFYLLKLWWKYIPVNVYRITVLQIHFTLELFIFRFCHN